jgi:hypothetical protein
MQLAFTKLNLILDGGLSHEVFHPKLVSMSLQVNGYDLKEPHQVGLTLIALTRRVSNSTTPEQLRGILRGRVKLIT